MTIEDHECRDEELRETVRSVRDEWAEQFGTVIAQHAELLDRIKHGFSFMGVPAYVKQNERMNGRSPSFADIVEEVTGSHQHPRPSMRVRAAFERVVGKVAIRIIVFVGGAGAALAVEHAIMALLHK